MVRRESDFEACLPSNLPNTLHSMSLHPPGVVQHNLQASVGLVKRLSHTQTFKGHSSAVNALDWSSDGAVLLSGSDDCRVKLWSVESGSAMQSFDSVSLIMHATRYPANHSCFEQPVTCQLDICRATPLAYMQQSLCRPLVTSK